MGWAIDQIMVEWINSNIKFGSIILELGSGYGTSKLVKNYKVYSVEQNVEWLNKIPNSNYIYAPIKQYGANLWYDISFIDKIDNNYKLLLVDGPTAPASRSGILQFIKKFYNGSTIILDDVDRPEDLKITQELSKILNKPYKIIKCPKSFAIIQ